MDFSPLIISFKTAVCSIVITFFIGIFVAEKIHLIKNRKIKIVLDSLLTLPMVLPPTVAGFFLLYLFGINRPIGRLFLEWFHLKIAFSWEATVLAAVVISFPLMYRSARSAFDQVDVDVIDAARTLGLTERYIFWKIRLPLAFSGVASGGILAFARGLGDFGATVMIAGNIAGKTRTLPLAVYSNVAAGRMDQADLYVWVLVTISFLVISLMNLCAEWRTHYYRRNGE